MDRFGWIAVLSDTHGVLPAFVSHALKADPPIHIIHAGDVCSNQILRDLRKIAPVTFVRGNMDGPKSGPSSEVADVNGLLLYVLHNLYDLDIDPGSIGISAVIHGHLHLASIEWKEGVLYLNPGSCAFPRGNRPASFARIELNGDTLCPEIVYQKIP